MEKKTLKDEYVTPQVRVIKVMIKNSILNVSSVHSTGKSDDMRQGGHLSIGRDRN